ncbi:NUDIX domain-containing protein [Kribbella solani]|uniref:8-oxo-dGTP pyrophosphatase MutT (NUDIX family) n=1 Tax=Kribbella solani TaxID=236067 RepID=A0A841DXG1_9ACTN|nr:8-oxo-dGTP pyrophosphatase MutT (NUDIX family) [Kribbella solani]
MKLLLVDPTDRLLLIHAKDPRTSAECWYPVGGGIEPGETLQSAAAREAYEETGLTALPPGELVWRRDHVYEYDGRRLDVHEEWLLHRVAHFSPRPTALTEHEARSILGFEWWSAAALGRTTATVFPPNLGRLLATLLNDGAYGPG